MRALLILILTLPTFSVVSQETHEFTLDNGLKVVVREDHRAPVAVSMIWYKVGSADEKGGYTGLSHALEHLMFKGTPKYPLGVFSRQIASLGGQENAFTNNDYTAYFEKIAASNLDTSLSLEADRMQNLILDKVEFGREIKVIQEERRLRTDDNPQALTFERFLAAAHLASPYHHPVIGWMDDLEEMTVEDARNWYKQYYAPNNATLVVVGDVQPQSIYELAKKHFGNIPSHLLPERKTQKEPPALGKKSIEVKVPAQIPLVLIGYTVPSVKTAPPHHPNDPYVLEVIGSILDAGDSGRVTQNLIRGKHIASTIDVYYNLYARYQTQFIIFGSPNQNHSIAEVKTGIWDELNKLKNEQVSVEELKRVKTQIIAEKIFERDSIFGQAMELGMLETIGLGWQTADKYVALINSVTPEQIQEVAKRYFNQESMTEAELIPQPSKKG